MIERTSVTLVFGMPGVGKTTLINNFIRHNANYVRLSGGSLIADEIAEAQRDVLRKLDPQEIMDNQSLLVKRFINKQMELTGSNIIFDGHCIIKNGDAEIEIPTDIIAQLRPSHIILLDEMPSIIIGRRLGDPSRPDREAEEISQLERGRNRQIEVCNMYSQELGVKLTILHNPTLQKFEQALLKAV